MTKRLTSKTRYPAFRMNPATNLLPELACGRRLRSTRQEIRRSFGTGVRARDNSRSREAIFVFLMVGRSTESMNLRRENTPATEKWQRPVGGDFPALDKPYRDLTAGEFAGLTSISMERHFRLNWLCERAPRNRWADTPTDTSSISSFRAVPYRTLRGFRFATTSRVSRISISAYSPETSY